MTSTRDYQESDFQTEFNKWLRHNNPAPLTSVFELKVTEGDTLPWSRVEDHQIDGLLAARDGVFVWKIPDIDMVKKPFDCMKITGAFAFIVVMFHAKDRGQKEFVMLEVGEFLRLREKGLKNGQKSLTQEMSEERGKVFQLA
jgi:hypothetical protein